jgi:hypothetical protein
MAELGAVKRTAGRTRYSQRVLGGGDLARFFGRLILLYFVEDLFLVPRVGECRRQGDFGGVGQTLRVFSDLARIQGFVRIGTAGGCRQTRAGRAASVACAGGRWFLSGGKHGGLLGFTDFFGARFARGQIDVSDDVLPKGIFGGELLFTSGEFCLTARRQCDAFAGLSGLPIVRSQSPVSGDPDFLILHEQVQGTFQFLLDLLG